MKRSSSLRIGQNIGLNKAGLTIWGYDTEGGFVCKLKINARGIKVFSGYGAAKQIADVNWEQLVRKLEE
jgi:hypothetical protein